MSEIKTKRAFVDALLQVSPKGTTIKEAEAATKAFGDAVALAIKGIKDGEKIVIPGICSITTRTSKAGERRNPRTGETVNVPAKRKPVLKPVAALSNAVSEG